MLPVLLVAALSQPPTLTNPPLSLYDPVSPFGLYARNISFSDGIYNTSEFGLTWIISPTNLTRHWYNHSIDGNAEDKSFDEQPFRTGQILWIQFDIPGTTSIAVRRLLGFLEVNRVDDQDTTNNTQPQLGIYQQNLDPAPDFVINDEPTNIRFGIQPMDHVDCDSITNEYSASKPFLCYTNQNITTLGTCTWSDSCTTDTFLSDGYVFQSSPMYDKQLYDTYIQNSTSPAARLQHRIGRYGSADTFNLNNHSVMECPDACFANNANKFPFSFSLNQVANYDPVYRGPDTTNPNLFYIQEGICRCYNTTTTNFTDVAFFSDDLDYFWQLHTYDILTNKFKPTDGDALQTAVNDYTSSLETVKGTKDERYYGEIGEWDITEVLTSGSIPGTSLSRLFMNKNSFDEDLGGWDVRDATNLQLMFYSADVFTGKGLQHWHVNNTQFFSYMFSDCAKFDGTVCENWDVSQASHFDYMFESANLSDVDFSNWEIFSGAQFSWATAGDAPNITMNSMFSGNKFFAGNGLASWNVTNVVDMRKMFHQTDNNLNEVFDPDLSTWDVSNVRDMGEIFAYNNKFTGRGLENWDMSMVTSLDSAFKGTSIAANLTNWDVSQVTTLSDAFSDTGLGSATVSVTGLEDWNVSSVEDLSLAFERTKVNANLSRWDTSRVTSMKSMFSSLQFSSGNINGYSSWNVSRVTDFSFMFYDSNELRDDLSGWGFTTQYTDFESMFEDAELSWSSPLLGGLINVESNPTRFEYWDLPVGNYKSMFSSATFLNSHDSITFKLGNSNASLEEAFKLVGGHNLPMPEIAIEVDGTGYIDVNNMFFQSFYSMSKIINIICNKTDSMVNVDTINGGSDPDLVGIRCPKCNITIEDTCNYGTCGPNTCYVWETYGSHIREPEVFPSGYNCSQHPFPNIWQGQKYTIYDGKNCIIYDQSGPTNEIASILTKCHSCGGTHRGPPSPSPPSPSPPSPSPPSPSPPSPSPPSPSPPTSGSDSKSSGSNAELIGGIAGGVILVVLCGVTYVFKCSSLGSKDEMTRQMLL